MFFLSFFECVKLFGISKEIRQNEAIKIYIRKFLEPKITLVFTTTEKAVMVAVKYDFNLKKKKKKKKIMRVNHQQENQSMKLPTLNVMMKWFILCINCKYSA